MMRILSFVMVVLFASSVFAVAATSSSTRLMWEGHRWGAFSSNGIVTSLVSNTIQMEGTATSSFWNSEGRLYKFFTGTRATVEIASDNVPASASGAGIWLKKDALNALIVEKHRDVTDPQYNTNVFIVEKIDGVNHFRYVSPDAPSIGFDSYSIEKTANGYTVYYNGLAVYSGTLDLTSYDRVELVGIARATGDQVKAAFRNYSEQ